MSQQQFNTLMSDFLKEKHALASLRAKIEEKRERECWSYKRFRHLVTVVLWTSSHILYGLPLHQKGDVSKATC